MAPGRESLEVLAGCTYVNTILTIPLQTPGLTPDNDDSPTMSRHPLETSQEYLRTRELHMSYTCTHLVIYAEAFFESINELLVIRVHTLMTVEPYLDRLPVSAKNAPPNAGGGLPATEAFAWIFSVLTYTKERT